MTDELLQTYVSLARHKIDPENTLHGMWDAIFDAEAILQGQPSICNRAEVEQMLREFVDHDG